MRDFLNNETIKFAYELLIEKLSVFIAAKNINRVRIGPPITPVLAVLPDGLDQKPHRIHWEVIFSVILTIANRTKVCNKLTMLDILSPVDN
jgi:hypothetical protein